MRISKKTSKSSGIRHALTRDQQRAFMDYMDKHPVYYHWWPLFTVLLGTGMRIGECLGKEITALIPTMKSLNPAKASQSAGDNNGFFAPNASIDFSNVKIEPLFEETVDFDTFSKSDFRAVKVKACQAVPKSKKLLQFTLDDGTGTDRTILSGIHAFYEPEELVGKTLVAITNLPPRPMMGIESCGMLLSAVNNLKDSEDEELHLLMIDNHIPAGAKLY